MRRLNRLPGLWMVVPLVLITIPVLGQTSNNVLVQGSPYSIINGVIFDASDQLHAASVLGGIFIIDQETGSMLGRLGPEQGVTSPDDLIFGPDGSLYWTNILQGEVGRLTPDGVTTSQLVAPGVNPITFSDDGRLFVACDFYGDGLYELDPEMVETPQVLIETLGWLNAFDFGPDGLLYGPIWTENRVVKIDVDAEPPTVETVFDGHHVSAVKFDSQGRLHATDNGSGEVLRVDVATGDTEVLAELVEGLDNLAFDSSDRLYVSSTVDGFIVEVLADGTVRTVVPGGLVAPSGVAVVPGADSDSVFVADLFSVREIDGASGQQLGWTTAGMTPGTVLYPITVAPHGDLLVLSSWFADVVQVLDPEQGEVVEEHYDFVLPTNAVSFQGDLVVAELGANLLAPRVLRVGNETTETLADGAQGLIYPLGLAATDDDLWVADWVTGRIWQLIADGVNLATPVMVATGLSSPEGLAVDNDGSLLVVEAGAAQLSRVDPETGASSVLVEGLDVGLPGRAGMLPHMFFSGVAVGSSGAIYVSGDVTRVLYRFTTEIFYVPAAAHIGGVGDTQWVSDLEIHNSADTTGDFSIALLPKGQDNSSPETVFFSLEPSSSAGYEDALQDLFDYTGSAALRVVTTGGDLMVSSRTYNNQPSGTFGQYIAGYTEAEALVAGQEGRLTGLSFSTNPGTGYRTNIGFANACGATISVDISLFAADGFEIGRTTVELGPYSYEQVTNVFNAVSAGDVEHGFAVVETTTAGARYFAYASVVDNRSGDGIYIPAR